jgi:uncharacterized OB-fold protein
VQESQVDMSASDTSPFGQYVKHLERGELAYQYSPAADRPVFFPRILCPYTGSETLEWRISSGRGVVYATSTVHPPTGEPYNVSLIDCDEGFRMMSRVEGLPPAEVQIGMQVEVRILPQPDGEPPIPVFHPVAGQS